MAHPERLVVGHPFNPVYLLPLVEVVRRRAHRARDGRARRRRLPARRDAPARARREVDGFVADRLLEALARGPLARR